VHPDEADDLDFDDANEGHLAGHGTRPGISVVEAYQVWNNGPVYVPNKAGMTATWLMLGDTYGGRALTIAVLVLEQSARLRPITGWDSTPGELTRWRGGRR
jgi:hypothetical protein